MHIFIYNYGLFRRETSQLSGLRRIITRGRQPEGDNTSQTWQLWCLPSKKSIIVLLSWRIFHLPPKIVLTISIPRRRSRQTSETSCTPIILPNICDLLAYNVIVQYFPLQKYCPKPYCFTDLMYTHRTCLNQHAFSLLRNSVCLQLSMPSLHYPNNLQFWSRIY